MNFQSIRRCLHVTTDCDCVGIESGEVSQSGRAFNIAERHFIADTAGIDVRMANLNQTEIITHCGKVTNAEISGRILLDNGQVDSVFIFARRSQSIVDIVMLRANRKVTRASDRVIAA